MFTTYRSATRPPLVAMIQGKIVEINRLRTLAVETPDPTRREKFSRIITRLEDETSRWQAMLSGGRA